MAATSPIARARRSTELSLVIMAGVITAGAYTLASLGEYAIIPARIIPFLAVLLALLLLAHLGIRWFAGGADPTMLPLAAILHGLGYVMITRLDDRLAGLQTTWSILAIAGFLLTLVVIQRAPDLARYRWSFLFGGVVLLLLPLVPGLGFGVGGARIWVNLGPINFQPGEFAKLALAIFFAGYLAENRELIADSNWKVGPFRLPEPRHLLPILLAWGFTVLVMVGQRDLGSSLLFFALFVVMMWIATERASYLVIGVIMFAVAAYVAWRLFDHVQTRVSIWLDPWADPLDSGYQIVQALYGLSDGGLAGTGLGLGSPGQVPEAQNDFIFTAIGEELGLFGAAAVLMAYILFIGAGLRTALRTDNTFEKLLSVGLTTILGVQAFIIVGGVIKVVPLTGITLPFVSYGGSSLLSNYILLALLIRLSDSGARRLHELPDDPTPSERWAAYRLRRRGGIDDSELVGVNRQIRQLAVGLMVCYVVLFAALNYWQIGREQELNARVDNTRAVRREFERPRGNLVTIDGVVVAQSEVNPPGSEFTYQRVYPAGDLFANVTGYYTFAFGATGLERTQNDVLTGSTPEQQLRNLPGIITGDDASGSVQMTLRSDLQQAAKDALGEREGSVVVIEPATGAVRAMWSFPSYDPNLVADPNFERARDVLTFYQHYPGDPLLANAFQQRYMPGSTFKILTTGIGLDAGVIDLSTTFPDEREWVPPQTNDPIENFQGTLCGGDLTEVFTRSCNIPFAKTAVEIGVDRMVAGVAAWGVGEPVPIDLPRPAASTFGDTSELAQNLPLLAIRGFGQNDDQMVPLHMAMVAATVANGGQMMAPYVVEATLDHDGRVLEQTPPEIWKTPISPGTAEILRGLMIGVAETGTASCCIALAGGIPVAAKTGTAQLNGPGEPERSHAWIVAFAPADNPQYTVAVMLKGTTEEISAGTGGRLAGPIAKTVLDAALAGGQG